MPDQTGDNKSTIKMPKQRDFAELMCDILAYTHVKALEGSFDFKKIAPYGASIILYNTVVRNLLVQQKLLPEGTSASKSAAFEIGSVIAIKYLVKMLMGGSNPKLMKDVLEVSAAYGISGMYMRIKDELAPGLTDVGSTKWPGQ